MSQIRGRKLPEQKWCTVPRVIRNALVLITIMGIATTLAPSVVAQTTSTSVTLTWTAKGDDGGTGTASQYDLRYSTAPITTSNWGTATVVTGLPAPKAAGSTETFTVNGLTSSTTYYFALKVADEVPNWSALSNVISRTTLAETTPPATIANLGASNETSTSVRLSWSAPGDDGNVGLASQYDVRYSTSAITAANFASATAVTGEPTPSAPGAVETFTVTGLNPVTTYYFAVKTADEVPNWSAISNVVSRATLQESTAPSNVSTLTALNPTPNSITLGWTAVGDDGLTGTATQYEIRYSTAPITTGNFSAATLVANPPVPKASGQVESFTVSGLAQGTTYYFALKVADEVPNWSGLSNVVSGTTTAPDVTPPDPVNDLSALPGTNIGEIGLLWTATGDDRKVGTARFYEIRYTLNPLNVTNFGQAMLWTAPPVPLPSGTAQSVVLTGLTPGSSYNIAMKVYDDAGNVSGISNVTSAVAKFSFGTSTDQVATLAQPPSGSTAPTSRPTLVVDNILSSGPNMYYFEVATDSNFMGLVAMGSQAEEVGAQTSWRVPQALNANQTYYWRVRANSFAYSAISSFAVEPQTHAYPNPFRPLSAGQAIFTDLPSGANVTLLSVSGEIVRQWSNAVDDIRWDGTNAQGNPVATGVYLWAVEGSAQQGKIIVIR
ncbi:MAG: fibronectin type III domain-containing protein [candidate division Zixibacteria bacterium]|nr:fibronectin type III domain-containing protein [candidate division Zixibacteria bacterium]